MKNLYFYIIFLLVFTTNNSIAQSDSLTIIHEKYVKAIGGQENLDKIQSIKIIVNASINNQMSMSEIIYKLRPNYIRKEITSNTYGTVITCWYLDSMLIWDKNLGEKPLHTWEATEKVTRRKQLNKKPVDNPYFYNSFVEYLKYKHIATYLGITTIQGKRCFYITVEQNKNTKIHYYINCDTYLLEHDYIESNLTPFSAKNFYSDYRLINGVMFAFNISGASYSGKLSSIVQYQSIETNFIVDPRLFECMPLTQKIEDIKD